MTNWTLFLDRDGVINTRIVGSYVRNWGEFEFMKGALEAMPIFKARFEQVLVATNQQGIAKGLMTAADLEKVHEQMLQTIAKAGGKIEKAYYCPLHERENPHCRKPNSGMAEQAKKDFPNIDFTKSIMVGDSPSDIEFGHRLGMKTVFITTRQDIPSQELIDIQPKIDFTFDSLYAFSQQLETILV
ncbi:MAG: HAD family hydrolase [Aureispira sp.]|nr:HAD family hydrolase [Aureispira sp.]